MAKRSKKESLFERATKVFRFPTLITVPPRVQYGALPWRMVDGTLEVLLLTSRGTGRWIIPKGWPIEGLGADGTAAREAYEEGGIEGAVTKEAIGEYHYEKMRDEGGAVDCVVYVHALQVSEQKESWPEMHQRTTRWFARKEAAELVAEPELRDLILFFSPPLPYA